MFYLFWRFQGQHQQGVGWDFRPAGGGGGGGDGESKTKQKTHKCSLSRCMCRRLVHAVPASTSAGRSTGREVTVPLLANEGMTVLLSRTLN